MNYCSSSTTDSQKNIKSWIPHYHIAVSEATHRTVAGIAVGGAGCMCECAV